MTRRTGAALWISCAVLLLLAGLVAGCTVGAEPAPTGRPASASVIGSTVIGATQRTSPSAGSRAAATDTQLVPVRDRMSSVPLAAGRTFGYLVGMPQQSAPSTGEPTIIYLHGFGERGNGSAAGLAILEQTGLPQLAARAQLPSTARDFLLLAPQTDAQSWNVTLLHQWIREVQRTYPIDPHRLYLTGISMGGGGVVGYLDAYGPASGIAAAAPIAGDWTPSPPVTGLPSCRRLGGTPIWAFAGDIDDVVPHQFSINLVAYLRGRCPAAGADRLTIYQGRFHDVWTHTYDLTGQRDKTDPRFDAYAPDLFTWLLEHRLG